MESHILLVEDNPGDRRLIQESLSEAGDSRFKLACAQCLATATEELRAGKPDAVLLDLSLPDSQGLETFTRVQTQASGVPIVVLTGLKDEEIALQAMRAGAQDYLLKGEITGGLLGRSLLYAIERKRAEEALRKSHEELELRVEERTAELSQANEQLQVELAERQRAQEAATRAKQEWERTFDSVPDLIAIIDGRHRILRANRAMAERLGRSPEQCVGATCYQAVHGLDHPPAVCPHVLTLKDGREHLAELAEARLGGDFLVSTTPLTDAEGKTIGSVHVARDITERKRAEESLRASEQRFRVLAEAMPQLVWSTDATGAIDYINPQTIAYAGAPPEGIHGWNWTSFLHPEDFEATTTAWRRSVTSGKPYRIEHRIRRADGEFRWHLTTAAPIRDASGLVMRWIGSATDIHEQKMAEQLLERRVQERTAELARTVALLETVTSNAPVILFATDAQGVFTLHTGKAIPATGRQAGEIGGKNYRDVLADTQAQDCLRRVLAGEEFTATAEARTGGIFETRYTPIRDSEGNIAGMIGLSIDITERKRAEQELHRLNRALRTISGCNQALVRAQDESELLREVCRIMIEVGEFRLAWVGVAEQDEAKTVRPVAFAGVEEGYLDTLKVTWADTERGRGPTGIALRTGQYSVCRNMLEDPRLAPWREEAVRRGYASSIALPLILDGRPGAALMLYSPAPDAFDARETELLVELSQDLAYGIQAIRNRAERRKAEDLAREHFKLAEAFFNHTLSSLVMLDRNYNFVHVNLAYAQACRKEVSDFIGKNHFDMYPSDVKEIFDEVLRTKTAVRIFAREFVFPDQPERGVTYWDWTLVPLFDQQGEVEYLIFSLNEVTERKRAEEALRLQADRYTTLLATTKDGFWVFDAKGRLLEVNDVYCRMSGYTRAELLNMTIPEVEASETPEEVARHIEKVIGSGFDRFETQHRRKDGTVFDVEISVTYWRETDRFLLFAHDITERKRAAERLKEERQRFNNLLNELPAYVALLTPDYHVSFANRTFRERFGESNGKPCYEFLFGRNEPCEVCETYEVLKTQRPHHWEWTGPDGRDYAVADFPFTETDGSTLILEMGIDVTERKRAEEEILRLSRRLLQAQEDERRRLARELHDSTAQGLAAIAINLSVVQATARMDEQGKKCLESAIEVAQECSEEVRNLSQLLHPPMLEQMGLPAALSWYAERFNRRTRIKVDLDISPQFSRLPKEVEIALYRIVQEGLTNVFRHSDSPRAKVQLLSDPSGVFLQIEDQGVGMSKTATESTEKGERRRGVGISSMRERVRQLGGLFEITSSSQGTTIRVTLPCGGK